ncbi:MAG: hypothetical protein GWP08_21215 [Nitrospiraceae bacterium]|nr:hypothetical protein [Nitrospiraceae bacterium]
MILKYTLAWIPMVFIAIVNGMARQLGYGKAMSELAAHQLSTATAVVLFVGYTWLLSLLWPLESARQALTIGAIWLTLTVAFEFLFGHYVAKHSWMRLLHDYNLMQGRVWVFVLVAIALAPYVIYRFRF